MEYAPRGPVYREKSGTADVTDRYKQKLSDFRNGTREQAIRELKSNKEWSNLATYIRSLEGNMWPTNRPRFRSSYVDNHLLRARIETLAQYTDVRPTISVTGPEEFSKQAQILKDLTVYEWLRNSMDIGLIKVLDHAMLSVGYFKVNGALGRASAIPCGMDTVMTVNCPGVFQESSACLYRVYKPIDYFRQKWGKEKADKIARSKKTNYTGQPASNYGPGVGMTEYSWSRLSPSMKYVMRDRVPDDGNSRDNRDTFPVAELEEFWWNDYNVNELSHPVTIKDPGASLADHNFWYVVKPGERLYPRKRLAIFGGEDENVYDGPTPYWTDEYPFSMLVLDPIVWGAGGLSKYRPLLPLNNGMNEIGAGMFDTVKKAINQAYVAKRGSVSPADWDRFFPEVPGQKMLMNNTADIRDVRALDPPQLPAYVFEFGRHLLTMFDRHAGSMDMQSLAKKKQVPGGDTMEQIRDSQSAPIRMEGRYIEAFLRDTGKIAVSHIIQFFTKKFRYSILGNDGVTWDDYNYDPTNMVPASHARETFWKLFEVKIEPGSIHGANKERDQVKALTLFRSGALSLETLLQKAGIGDIKGEIKRIMAEREGGIIPGGQSGRTPRMTRGQRNGQVA